MERLYSRRNNVEINCNGNILKTFTEKSRFDNEVEILRLLDGKHSPKLIAVDTNQMSIEMTFEDGQLLVDAFTQSNAKDARHLAIKVSETIVYLHKCMGSSIPYDENFRNYIVCKDEIVRVDFEQTRSGSMSQWCAKICAFALLYVAEKESKMCFVKTLVNTLKQSNADFSLLSNTDCSVKLNTGFSATSNTDCTVKLNTGFSATQNTDFSLLSNTDFCDELRREVEFLSNRWGVDFPSQTFLDVASIIN